MAALTINTLNRNGKYASSYSDAEVKHIYIWVCIKDSMEN